jgi:hypothetical protein
MAEVTSSSLVGSTYFFSRFAGRTKRGDKSRAGGRARHQGAIDLALEAREAGERRVILFNLCGHGHFDLAAYEQYLAGELVDLEHSEEEIERAVASIPD